MQIEEALDNNGESIKPDLQELISKFLNLYFGPENISKDGDVWKISVDDNEATLTVDSDGQWVIIFDRM